MDALCKNLTQLQLTSNETSVEKLFLCPYCGNYHKTDESTESSTSSIMDFDDLSFSSDLSDLSDDEMILQEPATPILPSTSPDTKN